MAWTLTRDALVAQRDEAVARAGREPVHRIWEELGRAHRWLDEEAAARRAFRAAAADLDERIERRGRGKPSRRGQTGVLLRLAGDAPGARHWLEWAIASSPSELDGQLAEVAAWRYLLGDPGGCLDAVEAMREPQPYRLTGAVAALARTRIEADPSAIGPTVEALAGMLRAERVAPAQTSGAADGGAYDWLEEAFSVEAELRGAAAPDHLTMLERAGLLAGGAPSPAPTSAPVELPVEGRWSIPRETPDAATVDLVLTRAPGATDALLDPRPGTELSVHFGEHRGEVRLEIEWGDHEDGWVQERLGPFADHAEAEEAAGDWLRAHAPDPPGGAWTADALLALLDTARTA